MFLSNISSIYSPPFPTHPPELWGKGLKMKSWLGNVGANAVKAREANIFDLLEMGTGKRTKLLCLGCATGKFTLTASERIGGKVNMYGIDINKSFLKEAKKKGIKTIPSDLNKKLPLKPNSFDVVLSDQVIEHLVDVENYIREIHRVLKPSGYAIISTENLSSWTNLFTMLLGYGPSPMHYSDEKNISGIPKLSPSYMTDVNYGYPPHTKLFTFHVLKELFKLHGFRIEKATGGGYYPAPKFLMRSMSKIDPRHAPYITIKIRKTGIS